MCPMHVARGPGARGAQEGSRRPQRGLSLACALSVMEANGGLGVEEGQDLAGGGEQNTGSRVGGGRAVSKP